MDSGDVDEMLGESKEEWEGVSCVEEQDKKMDFENKRKYDMLERMMEEDNKRVQMITQLYDRNEMQLKILDALANMVELLQKEYVYIKLMNRRKKMNKNKNKCAPTCVEY